MKGSITPQQKRYLLFAQRQKPEFIAKEIGRFGKSMDELSVKEATAILTAWEEYKKGEGGGEQKKKEEDQQDQQQDQQNEDQDDDEQDNRQEKQKMQRSGFRPGSKQEYIAQKLRENDLDSDKTRAAIKDEIGRVPQLTFTKNEGGERRPLPMGSMEDDSQQQTQFGRAIKTIFAVRRALLAGGEQGGGEKKQEHKQEQKQDKSREATDLLAWIRQTRKFCLDRAADGHPLDEIGLRPVEYGAKMLSAGIPVTAIKHAVTMHYPPEARRALGVRDYDVKGYKPDQRKEGVHAALPYVKALASQRIPIALVGPKGTGKTTLAIDLAEDMGLPFGMVSMTAGTSPSAFNGRPRVADDGTHGLIAALSNMSQIEGDDKKAIEFADEALTLARDAAEKGDTVLSLWCKIFGGGGVWLFDEMDAGEPNLVLGTNAALANGVFANPVTGQLIEQHPDFIPVAGMNTLGLGAGRDYTGRNKLDAATLDRWNSGRVQITLDERIEESLFWNIINGKS
jgi:MoxR-like ATPase